MDHCEVSKVRAEGAENLEEWVTQVEVNESVDDWHQEVVTVDEWGM